MSTILQPCFESQFIETTTVKLKFAPSSNSNSSSDVCGGLSFQQILADICSDCGGDTNTTPVVEKESVYVHPLSKRSSSSSYFSSYSSSSRILSEKSFEMCTENLGSETGTDDVMDINILSSSSYSSSPLPSPSPSPSPREYSPRSSKKLHSSSRNFPPPLTTISGANSLQVRSHRENGRLVLKAIESPIRHSFLQAERSNGRLTLTLHKHLDTQEENQEQELEEEEEEEENEISPINNQDSEEIDDDARDRDDDDDESDADFVPPNNNNNYDDIHEQEEEVYEMGREKYKRISTRCNIMNDGHGGRTNTVLCKPLWVATS